MPFFFIDKYYLIIVVPTLILALLAQLAISVTSKKYFNVQNVRRITGAFAAERVLHYYGITDIRIEQVGGNLTDHFDPSQKVIRLSEKVYSGTSISAVGIACHEAGHAAQHAQSYAPIKVRNALIPVINIGSTLWLPLFIIGLVFSAPFFMNFAIVLFAVIAVFQLVTLPIEINASRRAVGVIRETELLTPEEVPGAKRVLMTAAFTYVASLLTALAQLLRLLLLSNRRND